MWGIFRVGGGGWWFYMRGIFRVGGGGRWFYMRRLFGVVGGRRWFYLRRWMFGRQFWVFWGGRRIRAVRTCMGNEQSSKLEKEQ